MVKNNKGHIVEIASMSSFLGVGVFSDYSAGKTALISFTESESRSFVLHHRLSGIIPDRHCVCLSLSYLLQCNTLLRGLLLIFRSSRAASRMVRQSRCPRYGRSPLIRRDSYDLLPKGIDRSSHREDVDSFSCRKRDCKPDLQV